jgi:SnoaL-like domain
MMAVEQGLEREVVEFAERWVGRWNAHDPDGILALVTEDIVWEDPSIDGTARGLADARLYIETLFRAFPDIAWTMPAGLLLSLEDDVGIVKVGQPWTCRGTALGRIDPPGFAPTGKAFELEGFDVWDLQRSDGRARKVVSHYDALEFARLVGLMPARGSGGERVLVRVQRLKARLGAMRLR